MVHIGGLQVQFLNLNASLAVYPVINFGYCGFKFATLVSMKVCHQWNNAFPVIVLLQRVFIHARPNQHLHCVVNLKKILQIYNAILNAFLITLEIKTFAGKHVPLLLHIIVGNLCAQTQRPLAHP